MENTMHKSKDKKTNKPFTLRKPFAHSSASALAVCIPALLFNQSVSAQSNNSVNMDAIKVEERTADTNPYAEPGAPYKAKTSGDSRHVKPLAETPKTITVLTKEQIKDSSKTDLKDIVSMQPGITLGTGENGNAFGDRYVIRGHEARSDVFVDNISDPGMTTRESFATEQIEITKGPSSTFAGRGSTGGSINSVTKQATTEYSFSNFSLGVGTDNFSRFTIDSNTKLNEDFAFRANILAAQEDVPDREPADKSRKGIALSGAFEPTDEFRAVADYYYLQAEDKPDLGTNIRRLGSPVDDIPVYLQDQDFLDTEIEVLTFRLQYQFNDDLYLENATRYGTTDNGYVVTGARISTRNAIDPIAPGAETFTLSTHQGWQEIEYFVNQTNLILDTSIAGLENKFAFTLEISDEKVLNGVYNVDSTGATNCITTGRGGSPSDSYCFIDLNGNPVDSINNLMGRQITKGNSDSDFQVETISLSIMDTIDFSDRFSLTLGLRADSFDYRNVVINGGTTTEYKYDDVLMNYQLAAVYDITDNGKFYFNVSTSDNINGGESDTGSNCGYGGLCVDDSIDYANVDPEHSENFEIGTKWNLMDEKLLVSAALFQITKSDVMETAGRGSSYDPQGTLNTGENRVEGIEFSIAGNLSENISAVFGASFMDSEILKSVASPERVGKRLSNFADNSGFLQLKHQATPRFSYGAIATYKSEVNTGQPDSSADFDATTGEYSYTIPSYTVVDVFAKYDFTNKLSLSANINNVNDKDYYLAAYRSGAFTYIGDARNAQLTLSYDL
jgi:catecholate siderophore receptor